MRVHVKHQNGLWLVSPLAGDYRGRAIALAEGVSLAYAFKELSGISGSILATWGLTPLLDLDATTTKALVAFRPFDYRGMVDTPLSRFTRSQRIILMGATLQQLRSLNAV